MHVSALAALLSMLALSCQQFPAFMSESAVHVLHRPRQCSLYALCMLSVHPTCVPTGCLLTPVGKAEKAAYLPGFNGGTWFGSQGHHGDGLVQN